MEIDVGKQEGFAGAEFKAKEAVMTDEQKKYFDAAQATLDANQRFLMTYARDSSLRYKLGYGSGFYTNLETGEVTVDAKWFEEKGYSTTQILWALLHELSHVRDLLQDPEGMKKNFSHVKNQAKKTGAVILRKWEEVFGDDPEFLDKLKKQHPVGKGNETMSAIEMAAQKIHHTFYNIMDDVYVNFLISRRAPRFESGDGLQQMQSLYREKLFPNKTNPQLPPDFSDLPRHMQFTYALIRQEMVPDQPVTVSADVQEALQRKVMFLGRQYSPAEVVKTFVRPRSGRESFASKRHLIIQNTVEPVFLELLMKDLDEWQPQKPEVQQGQEGEPQEGQGSANPFDQQYQEFDQNSPDQHSDDEDEKVDQSIKKKQEQKKKEDQAAKEDKKSAEQKAAEAQGRQDRAWCSETQIEYHTLLRYRAIEKEIEPYLDELSNLWQRIIYGSSRRLDRAIQGHYREGAELDIPATVEQWPKIERDPFEARVMKKMVVTESLILKPDLIRVRLIGDLSGSMSGEKLHVLQQVFVLILSSIREFNTQLNLSRTQTHSKLTTDTEGWVFGSQSKKIKRLREDLGTSDEQAEIVRVFQQLNSDMGGTNDNVPFEEIMGSLTPQDRDNIAKQKVMEIVLEVTDGGTATPQQTRTAIDSLSEIGVITRAFQIGDVNDEEKRIFNEVWNKNREEPMGEIVGENIANLIPVMTQLLKKYLGNVRL